MSQDWQKKFSLIQKQCFIAIINCSQDTQLILCPYIEMRGVTVQKKYGAAMVTKKVREKKHL